MRCDRLWRLLRGDWATGGIWVVLRFRRWRSCSSWLSWRNVAWGMLSVHWCRGVGLRSRWTSWRSVGNAFFRTRFGRSSRCRRSLRSLTSSLMSIVFERRRWNLGFSFHQVWFVDYLLPKRCDFILNRYRGRWRYWLFACRNISLAGLLLLEHFTRSLPLRSQRICRLNHREL